MERPSNRQCKLARELQEVKQLMRESIKNLTVCHKQNGTSSVKF